MESGHNGNMSSAENVYSSKDVGSRDLRLCEREAV